MKSQDDIDFTTLRGQWKLQVSVVITRKVIGIRTKHHDKIIAHS